MTEDTAVAGVADTRTYLEKGITFDKAAKRYKARDAKVLAVKHVGEPKQYPTKHGTEMAYDGDYVVQVGEVEKLETIAPITKPDGTRIPGEKRTVREPLLEVMKAEDFDALYEPHK